MMTFSISDTNLNDQSCPFETYELRKLETFEISKERIANEMKLQEISDKLCKMEVAALKGTASKLNLLQAYLVCYKETLNDHIPVVLK